jgi:urease accessory protein
MQRIPSTALRCGMAAALAATATLAHAHPGHAAAGFLGGLAHPLALDHLMVALAVGIWSAAAFPRHKAWLGPAVFLGGLLAATAAACAGVSLPFAEAGIAATMVALGLVLTLALLGRGSAGAGLVVVTLAAACHGAAHVAEAPLATFAPYVGGFMLATALLHAAGVAAGTTVQHWRSMVRPFALAAGGAVSGAGLWLLFQ